MTGGSRKIKDDEPSFLKSFSRQLAISGERSEALTVMLMAGLFRSLLALRYRLTVSGLEQLDGISHALVLPNHPAEVDPIIVSTVLWKRLRPRPVVLETFYHLPVVHTVMRWIRALPMPDMAFDSGPYKQRRVVATVDAAIAALNSGESILMYPSGRLSTDGSEKIGGASGVYTLLKAAPNAPVVLIRTRGLYGSIFSKAVTGGAAPDLFATFGRAVLAVLENFVFFVPKRSVHLEITVNPPELRSATSVKECNQFLDQWYNYPAPETAHAISLSRWRDARPVLQARPPRPENEGEIPEEIRTRVTAKIAALAKTSPAKLRPESDLADELGLDSLAVAELLLWLDSEYSVTDLDLSELVTVGSAFDAAAGRIGQTSHHKPYLVPDDWTAESRARPEPYLARAQSLPQAFLRTADRFHRAYAASGDERSGVLTWGDFKTAVILLARRFAKLEGPSIGLLLPASVGSSLVTWAALLANKTPVFLNWTAGRRAVEHALSTADVRTVVTSRAFLDIVQSDLSFLDPVFLLLEDLRGSMTLPEKISAKLLSLRQAEYLGEYFGLSAIDPDRPAVILFTSGSESLPKGVPLSHRNLLSDIAGIVEVFRFQKSDVLFGFLPPFHSFGLTVCTVLPFVTGLRACYHPNPNESRKIASKVPAWSATLMAGTPTFLRSILRSGDRAGFQSLRIMVAGAERAPEDLFALAAEVAPNAEILEGYGITECSPVVSVNRPGTSKTGVGPPLAGVELAVVHPETMEPAAPETQGLILIRGATVFSGYVGVDHDPFVMVQGHRWYNSGDLGYLRDGSLIITGRLKRFIKIGGEMVSLGAVEDCLASLLPSFDGNPSLAVVSRGAEGEGRPQLVLFSTQSCSPDQANAALKAHGFPTLVKISEVREVPAIPLLGTGKSDLRSLQASLQS
jgi:long-chain-fatty-acid--[acyl-carrier-protein] ligase